MNKFFPYKKNCLIALFLFRGDEEFRPRVGGSRLPVHHSAVPGTRAFLRGHRNSCRAVLSIVDSGAQRRCRHSCLKLYFPSLSVVC